MGVKTDLMGQTFHRLTVIGAAKPNQWGQAVWSCRCSCGSTKEVQGQSLRSGSSKSCGCLKVETAKKLGRANRTHGKTHTGAYGSWRAMKRRCLEKTNKDFPRYGGRGITVCDRWRVSFENFLADMGERPPGHEIDRIDGKLGYFPTNCRWVVSHENGRNRSNTIWIAIGKVRRTAQEWSEISGIAVPTILMRIKRGWTTREAIYGKLKTRGDVTIDSRTQSLKAWALESGTRYGTIVGRLHRGWGEKEAVFGK